MSKVSNFRSKSSIQIQKSSEEELSEKSLSYLKQESNLEMLWEQFFAICDAEIGAVTTFNGCVKVSDNGKRERGEEESCLSKRPRLSPSDNKDDVLKSGVEIKKIALVLPKEGAEKLESGVKLQEEGALSLEEQFSEFDIAQILLQLSVIDSKTRKKTVRGG